MVNRNIATLKRVHLVMFDKKNLILVFFFTKCALAKCYPQCVTYHTYQIVSLFNFPLGFTPGPTFLQIFKLTLLEVP